jgi:hypothetical protein
MTMLMSLLLLFLRLFFGWRPCFLGFSAVAGVHPVASFPALADVSEITGVPGSLLLLPFLLLLITNDILLLAFQSLLRSNCFYCRACYGFLAVS